MNGLPLGLLVRYSARSCTKTQVSSNLSAVFPELNSQLMSLF
jgi:hypothetical protein